MVPTYISLVKTKVPTAGGTNAKNPNKKSLTKAGRSWPEKTLLDRNPWEEINPSKNIPGNRFDQL
jgi:hypothetical protein